MTQTGAVGPLTDDQFEKLVLLIDAAADRMTSAQGLSGRDHASAVRQYEWHKAQARLALVGEAVA